MAAGDGLISMTPTSIAYSGTSASINADGGVDFSAVTSLSLNGVFTGDYDNYLVVIEHVGDTDGRLDLKLRASGTDATATNYTYQTLSANSTTVSGARVSGEPYYTFGLTSSSSSGNGDHIHVYGPALAQPTAMRSVTTTGRDGARILDYACTHSLSTSYDGFTVVPASGTSNFTGTVHVFGYEE